MKFSLFYTTNSLTEYHPLGKLIVSCFPACLQMMVLYKETVIFLFLYYLISPRYIFARDFFTYSVNFFHQKNNLFK